MDLFLDRAIKTMTVIEEPAKAFISSRRYDIKKQYTDHNPSCSYSRVVEAAGQASTIDEECQEGQTCHKPKLRFSGSLKSTIYTNKPLLAQSNGGIEIEICNDDDQIIQTGQLASLRVEIVALEGDHSCKVEWSDDDFDRQMRKSRDGQGSVLDGKCIVELVNGRAPLALGDIRFKESSTGTRCREFVLAARVCRGENIGGPRVEEAFMRPAFTVLVEGSKGNEKCSVPKLDDKVHDLKGIARNGNYAGRLKRNNIHTVQGFLKAFNKGPDKLHQILEIKSQSSWEAITKHAIECDLRDRHGLKSYMVETENFSLFFNYVDDLVGAEFRGHFVAKDKFDSAQKVLVDAQLKQAYSRLDGINFGYVMQGDYPVKISRDINATGSTSIPTLLCVPPQIALGHEVQVSLHVARPCFYPRRCLRLCMGEEG